MKLNKKVEALLAFDVVIIISTIYCTIWGIFFGPEANPSCIDLYGINFFRAFTNDSNIFMAIVAAITFPYFIKIIFGKADKLPRWLTVLYLASATCLTLTFLVVVVFLAPKEALEGRSYFNMFVREGIFFHFINPVISFLGFSFFINCHKINLKEKFLCMVPMAIYAVVYLLNVAVFQTWRDFYGFTFGGQNQFIPIVIIVMFAITFAIICVLSCVHNHFVKKTNKTS